MKETINKIIIWAFCGLIFPLTFVLAVLLLRLGMWILTVKI